MEAPTLDKTDQLSVMRQCARIRGVVQGVGFRPFVYGLAKSLNLTGWVKNDGEGVLLEIEGALVDDFFLRLQSETPPLAHIHDIQRTNLAPKGDASFEIQTSTDGLISTMIGADACVCDACLAEMFTPTDRRYLYPFLNCTHCGPRYTITRRLPYDRKHTSMASFEMCSPCASEYKNPLDRRFHAQPTACPECGPHLSHSMDEIVQVIRDGKIVALKGIGGFHLVCDARNESAVKRLRERKGREAKPLAVMVLNSKSADLLANIGDVEGRQIESRARPIVLCREKPENGLAKSIAPGLSEIGLVLPYAPLHFLLFYEALDRPCGLEWLGKAQTPAFVLTSANPSDEPLVIGNDEAEARLSNIADLIVHHDREILVRNDDSVVRVIDGAPALIRRARGFAPDPIELPQEQPVTLALGAHLKNTICVTRGKEAFVSQHIGDLETSASYQFFQEMIGHLCDMLDVTPEIVACDMHPDFLSTRYAEEAGLPLVRVQHHHAHIASVAAEYGIRGRLLGVSLDGYGYGDAGDAWGGELLLHKGVSCARLGHLQQIALPGGDKASREPWRIAVGILADLGLTSKIEQRFGAHAEAGLISQIVARNLAPRTSSAGRLFDAAAGLLGVVERNQFEAEAAMRLESLVTRPLHHQDLCSYENGILNFNRLFETLAETENPSEGANLFHGALIDGLVHMICEAADAENETNIALTGGCFLNRTLTEGLTIQLREQGLNPLYPRKLPPGDGGISLGQAFIAGQSEIREIH